MNALLLACCSQEVSAAKGSGVLEAALAMQQAKRELFRPIGRKVA